MCPNFDRKLCKIKHFLSPIRSLIDNFLCLRHVLIELVKHYAKLKVSKIEGNTAVARRSEVIVKEIEKKIHGLSDLVQLFIS